PTRRSSDLVSCVPPVREPHAGLRGEKFPRTAGYHGTAPPPPASQAPTSCAAGRIGLRSARVRGAAWLACPGAPHLALLVRFALGAVIHLKRQRCKVGPCR